MYVAFFLTSLLAQMSMALYILYKELYFCCLRRAGWVIIVGGLFFVNRNLGTFLSPVTIWLANMPI